MSLANSSHSRLRVCVCTSYGAAAEPRAPRHAAAIAALGAGFEVVFVDMMPIGQPARPVKSLDNQTNLKCRTHYFPHRRAGLQRLIINQIRQRMARILYRRLRILQPIAVSTKSAGFQRILNEVHASVYYAHNIDALLPAARAANRYGASLMFDCMELYSEMGDCQIPLEREMVKVIESNWLPRCSLVTSSSEELSDELSSTYKIDRPLALYNVPPIEPCLPQRA